MRPDAGVIIAVVIAWALLVLVVPKRSWRQIRSRLRAMAAGERSYLYGNPRVPSAAGGRRLPKLAVSELIRLIEMGLPLFALALLVEARSRRRQQSMRDRWASSSSDLIDAHLAGRLTREDLEHRLAALGHLPLRSRERPDGPRQYLVPPISWRIDWENRLETAPRDAVLSEPPNVPYSSPPTPSGLRVQALGPLHIWDGDRDLAPVLLHRRVVAFTWLYLLARAILKAPITTESLADEGAPGLDPEARNVVLRNRLSRLRTDPDLRPLGALIVADGAYRGLGLDGCQIDVLELFDLVELAGAAGSLLPSELEGRIEETLASHEGEFLPSWDDLEAVANGGRGVAGDIIREVRRRVDDATCALLLSLAESARARRLTSRAVAYLERALDRNPERDDVVSRLAEVCMEMGNATYARRIRMRYGISEEIGPPERSASAPA